MDFIRSTSEKVKLWRVEHFFPPFFSRSMLIGGKFIFYNSSEFHFFGSISYEIHILVCTMTAEFSKYLPT